MDLTPESALAASFTFLSDQGQSPKAASTSEKEKTPTVGTGSGMPTSNAAATPIKREEADTSKHAISLAGTNTEIPVFSGEFKHYFSLFPPFIVYVTIYQAPLPRARCDIK